MHKVVILLITFSISLYGQIINKIPNIPKGNYPIASSNLQHDESKIATAITAGGDVGQYWEGRADGKKYISQLLPDNSGAIKFEVEIPNDPNLYGEEAGKTYTYVALMIYPTINSNNRTNYTLPGDFILQKMQTGSETPIFPDSESKLPILIYSHGKGSHPVSAISNMEYFASHGFATVALFYADSRYKEFGFLNLNEAQDIATRPLAASKLIDYLIEHDHYKDKLDFEKISAAGVSYGGATNIGLLGGEIMGTTLPSYSPNRKLHSDNRIKCAVGLVPYLGGESQGFIIPFFGVNHSGLQNVTKPYLTIAASNDEVAPYEYTEEAMLSMPGDKFLVKLDGLGHSLSPDANDDFLTWTMLFLGKYINNDSLSTFAFHSTTGIDGNETDNFIPLKSPEKPILDSPANEFKVTDESVELNWIFKNDVSYYNIQISDDTNFNNLLVDETASEGIKYTFNNIEENKLFFWRVKGINEISDGDYSETRSFYKGTITGIEDVIPLEYSLHQNYPNPFNPVTNISFSIPKESTVIIEIFNITGEKIATLMNKKLNEGNYKVLFNANELSSGVYFYSLKSNNYFEIKKMLLIK